MYTILTSTTVLMLIGLVAMGLLALWLIGRARDRRAFRRRFRETMKRVDDQLRARRRTPDLF